MKRERPLILAVDDEPANLALLGKLLKHHGYDVVQAIDGASALEAIAQHHPDLVCLDVMMPGLDGIEVCQRLRRQPEHIGLPILLLTALNRPEDKLRGLEAGADDFLSKPFDESELSARVRSLLRTRALQDRLGDLLGRYVSESVAAEALRDPFAVSLGGDRRHVSTLFADVRGYTALAADHSPEEALDLLNRYLTVVSDAVETHGGTVADLLGDGVFAFFGAPVMHSNDPERAVRAALAVQEAVLRLEIPSMPEVRLQTGIGITSGEVIAGNVGSERRMHYAVVGDSVIVAARLEAAAGPGQILVDESTHEAVRELVASQDLGSLRLAVKGDWVRAFNVIGLAPTAADAHAEFPIGDDQVGASSDTRPDHARPGD
jgi:adenylate cyclase